MNIYERFTAIRQRHRRPETPRANSGRSHCDSIKSKSVPTYCIIRIRIVCHRLHTRTQTHTDNHLCTGLIHKTTVQTISRNKLFTLPAPFFQACAIIHILFAQLFVRVANHGGKRNMHSRHETRTHVNGMRTLFDSFKCDELARFVAEVRRP